MEITTLTNVLCKLASFEQINCASDAETILPDGTKIISDSDGNIIFAHYENGARVIRHPDYVLCTDGSGEHWFGTNQTWYKLD